MTARALVARARRHGVRLYVDSGHIWADPPSLLPADLRAEIVAAQAKLKRILPAAAPVPCIRCGSVAWVVSVVDAALDRTCVDCWTGKNSLLRPGASS
jgi:hypothetical protein